MPAVTLTGEPWDMEHMPATVRATFRLDTSTGVGWDGANLLIGSVERNYPEQMHDPVVLAPGWWTLDLQRRGGSANFDPITLGPFQVVEGEVLSWRDIGEATTDVPDIAERVVAQLRANISALESAVVALQDAAPGAYDPTPVFDELAAETDQRQVADTAEAQARAAAVQALMDALAGRATSGDITTAVNALAAVARTGAYTDLTGRPTIPTSAAQIGAETPAGAQSKVDAAVSQLLGGAPAAALDTIKELADELGGEKSAIATIMTTLAAKASGADLATETTRAQAAEQANTTAIVNHAARTDNPHGTTKAQLGLDQVDNTSDANKLISTAAQVALATKLNLAGGALTGPLVLAGPPTNALHAATRQYVLDQIAGLVAAAPAELDTFVEAFNRFTADENALNALAGVVAGKQPADDDLTAIAALATTVFGRSLLTVADAAAARGAFGLGSAAIQPATAFATAAQGARADSAAQAPQIRIRTTDSAKVNNSTVLVAGDILSVALEANSTYRFQGEIYVVSNTTARAQLGWQAPGGASGFWTPDAPGQNAGGNAPTVNQMNRAVYDIAAAAPITAYSAPTACKPSGYVKTGATAGNLTITYAQAVATAVDTYLAAGSSLTLTKCATA